MIFFTLILAQLITNCFADREPKKSHFKNAKSKNPSPELSASFVNRVLFLWFDKLVWKGFWKPLEAPDMYDVMPENTAKELIKVFDRNWKENVLKNGKGKKLNDSVDGQTYVNCLYISFFYAEFHSFPYREIYFRYYLNPLGELFSCQHLLNYCAIY